jgi:hypothetical protein
VSLFGDNQALSGVQLVDHMGFRMSAGDFSPLDLAGCRSMYDASLVADGNYSSVLFTWDAQFLVEKLVRIGPGGALRVELSPEWQALLQFIAQDCRVKGDRTCGLVAGGV